MTFRANFVVRLATHVVWFVVMLGFFEVIFLHADRIGDWDRYRYLIFLGTFLAINGTINAFFIGNCVELGELIRSGNLDFALLKPVDEQFLITCRRIDWALVPQIVFGLGMAAFGAQTLGISVDAGRCLTYLIALFAGVTVLYGLLVALASCSFWTVQNRELIELWFLLLQFSSYPDEIFKQSATRNCGSFGVACFMPMVLAINLPAKYGAMLISEWTAIAWLLPLSVLVTIIGRVFFQLSIRHYQSAGS
jgi:ABC-2 type transport system permease protein